MTNAVDNTWVPAGAVALLLAVAGGLVFLDGPLESQRPPQGSAAPQSASGEELVMARLWQDPLHAIQGHWHRIVDYVGEHRTLPLSMDYPPTVRAFPSQSANLRLLVLMPSSPYVEDRESRRRQRHAVVSALTAYGFQPDDPEHIGYLVMPNLAAPDDTCETGNFPARCVALVGFERYERPSPDTESPGTSVQVLWLSAQDFSRVDHAALLLAVLNHSDNATAVLLGPYTSGALKDMAQRDGNLGASVKRLNDFPANVRGVLCAYGIDSSPPCEDDVESTRTELVEIEAVDRQRRDLDIVTAWATAPLNLLFQNENYVIDSAFGAAAVESLIANALDVRSFRSVVARDDLLLRDILLELKARGACRRGAPRLAIVAEQDTAYGQIFSDIITDLVSRHGELLCNFHVDTFGYLRGVDGELPPEVLSGRYAAGIDEDGATPSLSANGTIRVRATPEHAAGVARLDYVRRLADLISQHDAVPGDSAPDAFVARPVRPVAIGVLGSDVYDKLLVLQALREQIPSAVFFTTDLDARLTERSNYAFTRNLIVASTYGFTVATDDIARSAVFRSSYETALYRAVTLTLDGAHHGGSEERVENMVWTPCPRLFEIGRSGPVDITRYHHGCGQSGEIHGVALYYRSGSNLVERVWEAGLVFAPLLVLTLVAWWTSRTLPESARHRREAHGYVAFIGAASIMVLGLLSLGWRQHEPSPFFEGVSSVPALVLQFSTIVFSVCFCLIARGRITQGHEDIARQFDLPHWKGPEPWAGWIGQVIRVSTWRRELTNAYELRRQESGEDVWWQYLRLSEWRAVLLRVGAPVATFAVVLVFFFLRVDDVAPQVVRDLRTWVEGAALAMAVAILFSVFLCLDALSLARAFIGALTRSRRRVPGAGVLKGTTPLKEAASFDYVWQRRQKMLLMVDCTEALGPIMVLPFVLLLLPIAAANTVSEGWVWTWMFMAVYAGFTFYVLIRALLFQFEAVRAKEKILRELTEYRHEVVENPPLLSRLNFVIEEIEGVHRGAFVPWTRHPILQSIGATGIAIVTLVGALL